MMRQVMTLAFCLTAAATAGADFYDGQLDGALALNSSWTAGVDAVGTWYGDGYSLTDGHAQLDSYGTGQNINQMRPERHGLLQALPIPEAGKYSMSLDTFLDDYDTQFNYWMIYLAKPGAVFELAQDMVWTNAPAGAKKLKMGYAPNGKDDGSWYSYTTNFKISAGDATDYSYVVLMAVGSRHEDQALGWDNFSTNVPYAGGGAPVPEPSVLILGLLGCGAMMWCHRPAQR